MQNNATKKLWEEFDKVFEHFDRFFELAAEVVDSATKSEEPMKPQATGTTLKTIRLKGNRFKNFWSLLTTALRVLFRGTAKMRVRL